MVEGRYGGRKVKAGGHISSAVSKQEREASISLDPVSWDDDAHVRDRSSFLSKLFLPLSLSLSPSLSPYLSLSPSPLLLSLPLPLPLLSLSLETLSQNLPSDSKPGQVDDAD